MKNTNPLHYILDVITIIMIILDKSTYIIDKIRALLGKDDSDGGNK